MLSYIIRRLFVAIPILLLSTFLVFIMVSLTGDPLSEEKHRHPLLPASTIQADEHRLYLDRPFFTRYYLWLKGIVTRFDLGPNKGGLSTNSQLGSAITTTLRLVLIAMLLAALLAIVVGVISAVKQYSGIDYTFTFAGFLFLSMPVFWFAVLLKEFLAIDVNRWTGHRIFYTIGASTPDFQGSTLQHIENVAGHLVLPTIVLAMTQFAGWSRFQRASMLDVLNSDYVRLARAKGLSSRRVMVKHALRTALIPFVTVVAIDFAGFLSGTVVTETVFNWQGMGRLLLDSIRNRDLYITLSWLLVAAFAVIVFNLIADILYGFLDPRIRYE